MLIVGGKLIPVAINIAKDQNMLGKKVQKIIIFTTNIQRSMPDMEANPGLVIGVTSKFADLIQ